jgi:hypothetical protein
VYTFFIALFPFLNLVKLVKMAETIIQLEEEKESDGKLGSVKAINILVYCS